MPFLCNCQSKTWMPGTTPDMRENERTVYAHLIQ
jgi:hypothetical protein